MNGNFGVMIAVVLVVLVINFIFWLRRSKGVLKRTKPATSEEKARIIRHNEIQRRFVSEQEDILSFIEKRNKTLALYDQVRKQAAAAEKAQETASASEE